MAYRELAVVELRGIVRGGRVARMPRAIALSTGRDRKTIATCPAGPLENQQAPAGGHSVP